MLEQKETSDQDKSNLINLKVCENILETIMSDKMRYCADRFHKIRTQNVADTYTPMDLTQIQTKLSQGSYKNPQEFATDFRRMISETYRFCIDKDPIIEQAQELHHQFEMAFAKRIQLVTDEIDEDVEETMIQDEEMDETEILQNMLSVGRAM